MWPPTPSRFPPSGKETGSEHEGGSARADETEDAGTVAELKLRVFAAGKNPEKRKMKRFRYPRKKPTACTFGRSLDLRGRSALCLSSTFSLVGSTSVLWMMSSRCLGLEVTYARKVLRDQGAQALLCASISIFRRCKQNISERCAYIRVPILILN